MDLLQRRKDDDTPIFRAFVERTLKQHAEKINDAQNKAMSGFSSGFWNQRQISTNSESLILKHPIPERFVDMKSREVDGTKKPKKHHEVHNRIIMGNYNGILMDLTYGLTEDVKAQLKASFDGKVI